MSLPGGGDHSGIDAHIATLEEALDALTHGFIHGQLGDPWLCMATRNEENDDDAAAIDIDGEYNSSTETP